MQNVTFKIMILLQFISDTATANWVIAIAITVVGILLVRILNRIEKTQEDHSKRITIVETDVAVIKSKQE